MDLNDPNVPEPIRILAARLGAAFAEVGFQAIPPISEYLQAAEVPRQVSFSSRVDFWRDKDDNMRCRLVPSSPKLPTIELDTQEFTLTWHEGQLSFAYDGQPQEAEPEGGEPQPPAASPSPNAGANGADVPPPVPGTSDCEAFKATGQHAFIPTEDPDTFTCASCGGEGKRALPPRTDPRVARP